MFKKLNYQALYFYFICGVIIGVFFSPALNSICTGALMLTWLVEGKLKEKWNILKKRKAFLALISIFILHIAGLIYTSNFEYALKDLRIKLPILLIPIVFASVQALTLQRFHHALKILIIAALASSLYSLYLYIQFYGTEIKELREISVFISHIRLSLLNSIASFAAFYFIYLNRAKLLTIGNLLWLIAGIWLFVFNGILGARMGILVYFVMAAIGAAYLIIMWKKLWLTISLVVAVLAFPLITYYSIPSVKTRVNEIGFEVNNYQKGGDPSGHSIAQRFVFWKIAIDIFKTSPLIGIGTGDVDDAYRDYYSKHDVINKKFQHRAHNQYLTILFTFGIIGFIVFMYGVMSPMIYERKWDDYFYVVFIVTFLLSMTMEDTIETQAGVTYYAFFNSLFLFLRPKES